MKNSKFKIIIIAVIAILILGCAVFAWLYFGTDMFKSNKELFYKYASQFNLSDFINTENYNNFSKRKQTETHFSSGAIGVQVTKGEQTISDNLQYSSKNDPSNNKASSELNLIRNDQTILTMHYLKNQDLYGLKFDDLVKQYIVFENNNLKDFATKLGMQDTNSIPDKFEKINIDINTEEFKNLFNNYLNTIVSKIPDKNYSKLDNGYKVELNSTEFKEIMQTVFETMRTDEQIYNNLISIDKGLTFESYQNAIQILSNNVLAQIPDGVSGYINIIVYVQEKNAVKLSVVIPNTEISLEKTNGLTLKINNLNMETQISKTNNSEEQENWNMVSVFKEEGTEKLRINADFSRSGALTSQNVSFNMNINITMAEYSDYDSTISYSNNIDFTNGVEIEDYTEGNYAIINNYSPEQMESLFNNLGGLLTQKIDIENGAIYALISPIILVNSSMQSDEVIESLKATTLATDKETLLMAVVTTMDDSGRVNYQNLDASLPQGFTGSNGVYTSENGNSFTVSEDGTIENIVAGQNPEIQVEEFNSLFTIYEGSRSGVDIKNLVTAIETSNIANPNHLVEYDKAFAAAIDDSKQYQISFERDEAGFINKVIIAEQQ